MVLPLTSFQAPIDRIALALHMLEERHIQEMQWVQAFFQTLQENKIQLTGDQSYQLAQPVTVEKAVHVAQHYGIPLEKIDATNAQISSAGRAAPGTPRLMEVAEMMGYMPKHRSAPLLGAQAASKMVSNMQSLADGTNTIDLQNAIQPREWIDTGVRKGEPEYLIAAQATHHLSDIFSAALMQAKNPRLMQDPDIQRAMAAFEIYASQTLKRSGKELDKLGLSSAGQHIANSRDPLHGVGKLGVFSEFANTSAMVTDMQKGFEVLQRTHALPAGTMGMVNQRLEQAREMNHKGINLLGGMRHKHEVNAQSWASRVQNSASHGGQGHGL